ncbi:hypothetical protein F5Y18DRAFT_290234 [Xylariaceae sp. FL1019]|nr:hypothetical protein F5Y18DRAFT_290234 [Xylariaceae sp. FL1019]
MPSLFSVKYSIITVLALAQLSFASYYHNRSGGGSPFDKRSTRSNFVQLGIRDDGSVAAGKLVGMIGHVSGLVMQPDSPQDLSNPTKSRRQAQQTLLNCKEGLEQATVHFSSPLTGNLLVAGVPPACMTLAGTIFGDDKPIPVGPESLLFQNIDDADMVEIQAALDSHMETR